mmetsp:Transcript_40652/g.102330  ORF Transcript_40652/g.102330 Transcript_40652/m.102330 type:complete len:271 (-) Transcript_40652:171-983(-)|eukprot:CAMPEP_0177647808 /NCGR_PEP_ID=MMETSP0447-20121125/10495_1 /TAXON_ID=0 /ORGANISM="Stygamoeba regulata, Strain BSH-02190019" /LENGTH=270 /DNA_ID=CAMNT_0019150413 /DNA_START=137 /DNA_END=949 /DNA_ORIENTATION=-
MSSKPSKSVPVEITPVKVMPDGEQINSWFNFRPYLCTFEYENQLCADLQMLAFTSRHVHEGENKGLPEVICEGLRFGLFGLAFQLLQKRFEQFPSCNICSQCLEVLQPLSQVVAIPRLQPGEESISLRTLTEWKCHKVSDDIRAHALRLRDEHLCYSCQGKLDHCDCRDSEETSGMISMWLEDAADLEGAVSGFLYREYGSVSGGRLDTSVREKIPFVAYAMGNIARARILSVEEIDAFLDQTQVPIPLAYAQSRLEDPMDDPKPDQPQS